MATEELRGAAEPAGGVPGRFIAYARSRKGTVLLAEMASSLIVFICFCASLYGGYPTAPAIEMVLSAIFFVIFMNHFDQSISFVNWPWTDFLRCAIAVIIYVIISIIALLTGLGVQIAGGIFGLLSAAIFAYDAYLIFPSLKLRHVPAASEPPDENA